MGIAVIAFLLLAGSVAAPVPAQAQSSTAPAVEERIVVAQHMGARPAFRPGGRPGLRPRPPGFNRPAAGARPPTAVVRPDGSSVVVRPIGGLRPRPPGWRPPAARPPYWRAWRPGLGYAITTGVISSAIAANLGWCHVHRYPELDKEFHQDVRCHRHADWDSPAISYVYAR